MDLDAIKRRREAATPGPWRVNAMGLVEDVEGIQLQSGDPHAVVMDDNTAAFIAHAWEDVGALLAEVERLRQIEALAR